MNLVLLSPSDFINSNEIVIHGKDRRLIHILNVHKAKIGTKLLVGVLNSRIGTGLITNIDKNICKITITLTDNPPPPLPCILVIALQRPKVLKRILECVSGLGIKKIYIIETWRVEKSFWNSPLLNQKYFEKHCILGLEQSKDTVLPSIETRKKFKPFVEDELPQIIKGTKALVAHPEAKNVFPAFSGEKVTLAIGPEGGFIPYEIEMLNKNGFDIINFGKRIIKTEWFIPFAIGKLFPNI